MDPELRRIADGCCKRYGARVNEATYEELRQCARLAAWQWAERYPRRPGKPWLNGLRSRVRGAIVDHLRDVDWLSRAQRLAAGSAWQMQYLADNEIDRPDAAAHVGQRRAEARHDVQAIIRAAAHELTELERCVLQGYLRGVSGVEIASQIQRTEGRVAQIRHEAIA